MIDIRDLKKSFGGTQAVNGVSFEVAAGETFGLLGPNGAGKSTTLLMICGLLRPDEGTVTVCGVSDMMQPENRRALGIAPQALSLYEELTAKENLTFFGRLYGLSGEKLAERTRWALDFAELSDRKNDRVQTYSGGMKRRLNLAIGLLHEPKVVLLDEPTVGVDPQSRNHIFERIQDLQDSGLTVIYTTHYMEEAQRLCDRVAIMDAGKILDMDTVSNLISRHGGRSVVRAELSRPPEDISLLPAPLEGLSLRFESEQPLELVGQMSAAGVSFQTLEVARPDLETVFLTLTGRSLRD